MTKRQQRRHHWAAKGYDGPPLEFERLTRPTPEYNMAATGEREKAPLRARAAKARTQFTAAHEGPREKVGTPEKQYVLTPGGRVEREVHAKQDREAANRNKQKDAQMKAWRETPITTSRAFNTRTLKPGRLRARVTPEVFRKRGRGAERGR